MNSIKFNNSLDKLPDSLEFLYINDYNKPINKLPKNLQFIYMNCENRIIREIKKIHQDI